eukprot:Skav227477  [mRNA]  locus=scaffold2491:481829:483583:+ [translate_table: standard]
MISSLPGRVTVGVSTPSGQTCTIAALAAGRVDQLHGAVERVLKIPRVVQRLIFAGREIYSEEFLARLHVENGSNISVINSLPQNPASIVERLHCAASTRPTHCLAAAVAQCLEHEEWSVKVAAAQTLSWMGQIAVPHASAIARLLSDDQPEVRSAAAESLSWMEESGAKYAGDILASAGEFRPTHFGGFNFLLAQKPKDAVQALLQSELPSTRLAAIKSVLRLLEERDWHPRNPREKLLLQEFLLPYWCRAFFVDPSEDVRKTVAEYLVSQIPTFDAGAEVQPLEEGLICQFIRFGEDIKFDKAKLTNDEVSTTACKEIAKKLDGHWPYWPQWAGGQEGLDDPDTSVKAAACQVSVAMVQYLRRRFCEWLVAPGGYQALLQDLQHYPFNMIYAVKDLLRPMVEDGLMSFEWQVRQAVVESLISLEPFGEQARYALQHAREAEKEKPVLETMARFFAVYDDYSECYSPGCYYWRDCPEENENDRLEWPLEVELSKLRKLHETGAGYSKSHLSRAARHKKKHGVDSSHAPSTIARQKKEERRNARPEKAENFSESKRKNQRDKEQDRQLKTAMLGHELLRFAVENA